MKIFLFLASILLAGVASADSKVEVRVNRIDMAVAGGYERRRRCKRRHTCPGLQLQPLEYHVVTGSGREYRPACCLGRQGTGLQFQSLEQLERRRAATEQYQRPFHRPR